MNQYLVATLSEATSSPYLLGGTFVSRHRFHNLRLLTIVTLVETATLTSAADLDEASQRDRPRGTIAFSSVGVRHWDVYLGGVGGSECPVTRNRALDFNAAFSPDDRMIAFVSERHGNMESSRSDEAPRDNQREIQQNPDRSTLRSPEAGNNDQSESALSIFRKRVLPIFHAKKPSSCTECHLSGVDLKDYIHSDQQKTFASLVGAGLINTSKPDDSKILAFIKRKPDNPNLITDSIRKKEYAAFRAWIRAAVREPGLLAAKSRAKLGPSLPDEVIRHARKDRVLASFIDNIWTEVGRCAGCHSPDQNQKQVREHGEQVSWITLSDPRATIQYMIEADLIDTQTPEESLLLLKPSMQVEHRGGQKMIVGDRSYRQFRRFIDDYAAMVSGRYKSPDDLPEQDDEVSVATTMTNGIWLKLENVPAEYDKKLLQVDLFRREGQGWSAMRWATADRAVAGNLHLWQQTLSLTAPRGSQRAKEIHRRVLPPGEYLVKIYVDIDGKLQRNSVTGLGPEGLVGQVVVNSQWRKGYGKMTVTRFPSR